MNKHRISQLIFVLLGSFIFTCGLKLFLVPNELIDGGVVGISIILSHLSNQSLGLILLLLNIPFIFIGYKRIGKEFALLSLIGVASMTVFTYLLKGMSPIVTDPLLSAVFGGIFLGIGVGLVIRNGGSLDGTEIVAILIEKKIPFSVGDIVMTMNVFILGSAAFVFGPQNAMFSMITYYIAVKVLDNVVEGFDKSRAVIIISQKAEEVSQAILNEVHASTSLIDMKGGYSQEPQQMIYCVINILEETKLKSVIESVDEDALLFITHVHETKGIHRKKSH